MVLERSKAGRKSANGRLWEALVLLAALVLGDLVTGEPS